jgi:hypothetical protein
VQRYKKELREERKEEKRKRGENTNIEDDPT